MDSSRFDEFTKAIATTTSRRQVLRQIGSILAGMGLAGLIPAAALADNSDCARFCDSVFGPGPDRGQCKSDAANNTGLCYTCGPASPNGTQAVCCPQNPDGTCSSYSSATCCTSGQTCMNGTCASNPLCGPPCPEGTVQLSNGTCAYACADSSCDPGTVCLGDADSSSNVLYCTNGGGTGGVCGQNSDCPCGEICVPVLGGCIKAGGGTPIGTTTTTLPPP